MDLESSRAYNQLHRIGHRHTQSLASSGLSPIPSLSSIATATSSASTVLHTPTSAVSFLPEDTPTPTPSPKPKQPRTSISLIRRLSLKTPPPRAQVSTAMTSTRGRRVGETPLVDRDVSVSAYNTATRQPRRTDSMPSTPLRKHSYSSTSTSSSSQHPSSSTSSSSMSEHLLRSTLRKDDTSHKKRHSRSQSRTRLDTDLLNGSFLFRTPMISSPTPRSSKKPLIGFSLGDDLSSDEGSTSHSGSGSWADDRTRNGNGTPTRGHTGGYSGPAGNPHHAQRRDLQHSPCPSPSPAQGSLSLRHAQSPRHGHARSQSYTYIDRSSSPAPKVPLTPHEQVLKARLERVLSAGSVAQTSPGSIYRPSKEKELDGDEERFEDYVNYNHEKKRKRSSAPTGKEGSMFGWLWAGKAGSGSSSGSEETNPQLPTPSTPSQTQRERESYMSPRTPSLPPSNSYSPHVHSSPYHSPSYYRGQSPHTNSPGRTRSHTAPAPSSPSATMKGTPKRQHAFTLPGMLESVPSVGELRERAAAEAEASSPKSKPVPEASKESGKMITPPPTPPRREREFDGDSAVDLEQDATPRKIRPHHVAPLALSLAPSTSALAQRRGSASTFTTARPVAEGSKVARSKSMSTNTGRANLGLGRPSLSRNPSELTEASSISRISSPTKASFTSAVSPTSATSAPKDSSFSPDGPSPSFSLSPAFTSPSSINSQSNFNARTASIQCRRMEGYVSFSSVEGLGEPPSSAHPSLASDRGSMFGDEEDDGDKKEGKRFLGLGWILGK
ncbi:hypothetical protein VKT23_014492 [Stygiomarasmius scandens]|uniref:Uncharacterized protein n=1 Tax=Marasmiellus scandens TaxID=2682957 RepID=A0ABR1J0C3_9AGAR